MNPAFELDRGRLRSVVSSRRWILTAGIALNTIFWIVRIAVEWSTLGMFYVVGVDWSRFWGAARAFVVVGPKSGYDLNAIAHFMQPFLLYYSDNINSVALKVGPAPYPPIFLALFAPFTIPPPQIGFLLWTIANLLIAIPVARSLAGHFPADQQRAVTTLLLLFFPLMMALFVGQMVIILLFAFWKAYQALEQGDDFRAGLWLGVLLIKPQYAVVLLAVLLLKRRYWAIGGSALTALAVLLSSLLVGGVDGVVAYVRMILVDYPNYSGGLAIDPQSMISWRALVLNLIPNVGKTEGLVLTALLSLISLVMLAVIWRGEWNPRSPRFANQMLATMIVSLLVAYHSQVHGAVLLMVPGALIAAGSPSSPFIKKLILVSVFGPPFATLLSLIIQGNAGMVSLLYLPLMIMALIAILKYDWTFGARAGLLGPPVPSIVAAGNDTEPWRR
ncbi:MAG TPA: glycosyltransferase family 87 protein [Nitrolancea sp.]|nr:glycosyltransferase family 87 protein [Nitrolancea sp.]